MKMLDLIRYDIPPEVAELWCEREGKFLLPLQEAAVKSHDLFGRDNLLIQAPTSSGKTFIGEMAGVHTALRRKKVVYLVPLKALAEEKYEDFRAKYDGYGLKVIISTRDHREFDRDFERGRFSIAVVVYEKLSQLLVRRPERLAEIALVVADELELLSDPERGSMAELLLTRLLRSDCRLIGLSAVIGDAQRLASWMGAKLVFHDRRPVELRYGILRDGVFKYRTYNDQGHGEETLIDVPGGSTRDLLVQNVRHLVKQGQSCLVFVKAKHESRQGAELLAEELDGPSAETALDVLRDLEETRSRQCLLETMSRGVAFHNADLSPAERAVVETAFRRGDVKVIVSTSTLAVGMNLPAQNVFLGADKWRYDARFGMPWKAPILRSEYENMSGRAGRFGAGHDFGRAMMIATSEFDEETLWRRYVEGERESIEPRLAHEPLDNRVLQLVASRSCRTDDELTSFFESTLTGQWVWLDSLTLEELSFRVRAATNRTIDAGMVQKDRHGVLHPTPFGQAVASKGVAIQTAQDLEHWLLESESRLWNPIDLLLAAALTADGRALNVALTTSEYDRADYPGQLKALTQAEDLFADVPLNRFRNSNEMPFFEEVRAIKIALFLQQWIAGARLSHLEEAFHTMAGQILSAAEQLSWLVDAAAAIAMAQGAAPVFVDRLARLADRLQYGLPGEAVLLRRIRTAKLTRNQVLGLIEEDLHTAAALREAPDKTLARHVSPKQARQLKQWARRQHGDPTPTAPTLVLDESRPNQLQWEGCTVALQDKQYRLIRLLAATPGQCVPYESIYEAVWGDTVVENNQVHFQKHQLLDRIAGVAPQHAKVVATVPKRGYVLNLRPDEVACFPAHQADACCIK